MMIGVLTSCPSIPASAETPPAATRVVIVGMQRCCASQALPATEQLLRAELAAKDFLVELVDGTAGGERERRIELAVVAEERQATCGLRVLDAGKTAVTVEIWANVGGTGQPTFAEMRIDAEEAAEAATIIALRVAELLEVRAQPPTPAAVIEHDPAPSQPPRPSPPAFGLQLSATALASAATPGWFGVGNLSIAWHAVAPVVLEGEVLLSLLGPRLARGDDRATLSLAGARLWLLGELEIWGGFHGQLGAGAGVLRVATHSPRSIVYAERDAAALVAYAGGLLRVSRALGRWVRLLLTLRLGGALPNLEVRFAGFHVARFGAPIWEAGAGLELSLPLEEEP